MGYGERESFVCFFIALYGVVISWEEVGEMVGLFFFVLCFILDLFFHSLSPNRQLYFSAPASSLFLPLFCTHLSLSLACLMENWKDPHLLWLSVSVTTVLKNKTKRELDVFIIYPNKKRNMLWLIQMCTLSTESYILISAILIITCGMSKGCDRRCRISFQIKKKLELLLQSFNLKHVILLIYKTKKVKTVEKES